MILKELLIKKVFFIILLSMIFSKGEISGVSYFNYTYNLTDNAINNEGFSLTRVYFTYKNDISKDVSFKFQSDIDYNNSPAYLYLKKAQLDWKSPIGKITLGMQGMNMFNITEKNWGFRFIEKSPMDRHGFSSSADMGIGYHNRISRLSYNLLITNGVGYKSQGDDKFNKISLQAVYGKRNITKEGDFNIGASFSTEPYEIYQGPLPQLGIEESTDLYNRKVMSFFGGYAINEVFRVGGEFDICTDSGSHAEQIIAFYYSYKAMDNLEGLLYIDMYDPDTDTEKNSETYIILGVNYYAAKGLIIAPNARFTLYEDDRDKEALFKINFQFRF